MANRALLVGIDEYEVPGNELNSCVNDTYAFRDWLKQSDFSDNAEIRMLHNEDATLARVRDGLDWLLTDAESGDRCVFYQSSHGYRYQPEDEPGTFVEVLVCHDRYQFLHDSELVERSRQVDPGALTVILDACHSGGMNKDWIDPQQRFQTARAKVFIPPADMLAAQAKSLAGVEAPTLKLFGRSATRSATKLFAGARAGTKGPKAQPEVEINAVLLTACTARQTAAAGSERTNDLSAFTHALLKGVDSSTPVSDLIERAGETLDDLGMEQTPGCFAPQDLQPLLSEPLLAEQPTGKEPTTMTMTATTTPTERDIRKALQPLIDAATGAASKKPSGKGYKGAGSGADGKPDVVAYAAKLVPAFAAVSKAAGVKPKSLYLDDFYMDQIDGGWLTDVLDTSWQMTNCFPQTYLDLFAETPSKDFAEDALTRIKRKVPRKVFEDPAFWDSVVHVLVTLAPVVIDMVTGDGSSDKSVKDPKSFWDDIVEGVGDFVEDAIPTAVDVAQVVLPWII
ncbi:caspase family protein [Streptomyces sp. RP5T]|uniref:caspase family protein n=1 Tax=Streptomyces sp. RP5T TaxID=2490848 RepID=UPI000F64BA2E|nr:caspase family protein [Streptomyces sp. RP5T]RRR74796.1 caspase family protein [Streptomyces sp. RP5T]